MWQNYTKISSEGLGRLSIYTGSRVGECDVHKSVSDNNILSYFC